MSDEAVETTKEIEILGETWTIHFRDEDPCFEKSRGYTNCATREIVVENVRDTDDPLDFDMQSQCIDQKRVLRHEILHAFLMESGLDENSNSCDGWALNEEMVDWFARQSPKIFKVYNKLKIL